MNDDDKKDEGEKPCEQTPHPGGPPVNPIPGSAPPK